MSDDTTKTGSEKKPSASFSDEQITELSMLAGVSAETSPWSVERFEYLLQEVAIIFGRPSESLGDVRKRMRKAAKQVCGLSENFEALLSHDDALAAVVRAGANMSHGVQFDIQTLLGLSRDLHSLKEVFQRAQNDPIFPGSSGGRPRDTGHMRAAIQLLEKAWGEAIPGRSAGTSYDPSSDVRGGPFVRFACAALGFLDPAVKKQRGFGQTVRNALAEIREEGVGGGNPNPDR